MLTQEYLKSILHYNQITGLFTWIVNKKNTKTKGRLVTSKANNGYIRVKIDYKSYSCHRLAWLYVHGEWPKVIDHINGIRDDNRLINLRNGTMFDNHQNRKEHREKTVKGYSYIKRDKKWLSSIRLNKIQYHLGYSDTELEAKELYECVLFLLKELGLK